MDETTEVAGMNDAGPHISNGMWGSVHFAWFDPDNPIGSTKTPGGDSGNVVRDNHGSIQLTLNNPCVGFDDLSGTSSTRMFTIDPAHAGDNYIVAVHPNDGVVDEYVFENEDQYNTSNYYGVVGRTLLYPEPSAMFGDHTELPKAMQTKVLTVWRTLNVECDRMNYWPPGTENFPFGPPNPADFLGGRVETELARACVSVNAIRPSTAQNPTLNVTQPLVMMDTSTGIITDDNPGTNPMDDNYMGALLGGVGTWSGRDLAGNDKNFWTVRIVMTSAYKPLGGESILAGAFFPGWNTIIVCHARIEEVRQSWNTNFSDNVSLKEWVEEVMLHEICHVLIDDKEIDVYFDTNGKDVYRNFDRFFLTNQITDTSVIGVRDHQWRIMPAPPGMERNKRTDGRNRVNFTRLIPDDIQEIQFHSRARD